MFDIHVFLATAAATADNDAGCTAGERYSLLIFSRQPIGEKPDAKLASKGAALAGWKDVELEKARRLPSGAAPGDPILREAFGDALSEGYAVVAHRRRLNRDEAVSDASLVRKPPRRQKTRG